MLKQKVIRVTAAGPDVEFATAVILSSGHFYCNVQPLLSQSGMLDDPARSMG